MFNYAIMVNPGHNRVYFEASKKLSISELTIALGRIDSSYSSISETYIENIFYITFQTENKLEHDNVSIIAKLSFVYAFFELIVMNEIQYLLPQLLPSSQHINSNISSILKYSGKTNELFTRMMINVGLFSSPFLNENIKLLDPVAGKGTTLYEALICGYDAYGIEIAENTANEAFHYIKKYLELEKYKHSTNIGKISGSHKSFTSKKFSVDFAKTKDDFKNNKSYHWEILAGNSMYANHYFKKNFFNLMVGDLPYGVQHGNITNQKGSSLTRSPKELIANCIASWHQVLKPEGVMVLAWNTFVFPREEFVDLLSENGFCVFNDGIYLEFEHRVDQSIKRDIIVAQKI